MSDKDRTGTRTYVEMAFAIERKPLDYLIESTVNNHHDRYHKVIGNYRSDSHCRKVDFSAISTTTARKVTFDKVLTLA